ncbi:MAG: YafY family protein [Acidimicrobiales bacterium]|jgi:predicted DNA-binding transcriptional regulator YafY
MRADRLVAALLVLQSRGRVTARELAQELEVSTRTARRDLEGLAMAGIPVYSQPGRGGGWTLIGGSRTDLSGLTAAEARTLFLVAGPATATPELKTALRKLVRALPATFRSEAEAAAGAVVLDPTSWDHGAPAPPRHLEPLQRAVIEAVQVRLGYTRRDGAVSTRVVHPLGLVVKNQVWYLIARTDVGQRTFRVNRVRSVEPTGEPVERPDGFDLAATWRAIVTTLDAQRAPARVHVRTDPDALDILRYMFGRRVVEGATGADGQTEVEIRGTSEEMVARQLAGLADRVEVRAPEAVRQHLTAIGHALVQRYGPPSGGGG